MKGYRFTCKKCLKVCKSNAAYTMHTKYAKGCKEDSRKIGRFCQYFCIICRESFVKKIEFENHVKNHGGQLIETKNNDDIQSKNEESTYFDGSVKQKRLIWKKPDACDQTKTVFKTILPSKREAEKPKLENDSDKTDEKTQDCDAENITNMLKNAAKKPKLEKDSEKSDEKTQDCDENLTTMPKIDAETSSKKTYRVIDQSLPNGWSKKAIERLSKDKWDVYLITPDQKILVYPSDLKIYVMKSGTVVDFNLVNFSLPEISDKNITVQKMDIKKEAAKKVF